MKHLVILLSLAVGAAFLYGLWLYGESLQLKRQGTPVPYTELLRNDFGEKQKAVSDWLDN